MRFAGVSHPEWGYLAPQPSFLRTTRLMAIAAAVGAVAGSGVVFALVDRPVGETSVAARTLVQPAPASTSTAAAAASAPTANATLDSAVSPQNPARLLRPSAAGSTPAASETPSQRTEQRIRALSTLAEAPAAAVEPSTPARELTSPAASAATTGQPASTQKKVAKKRRPSPLYAWRGDRSDGVGREALSLRNFFNSAPDSEYSANDGYRRDGGWGYRNEW